ncbi:DUF3592 domain-containing protein [Corynebacterium sp.]|uniref:DUF3592 domain-containing protein n=1 Tax=Corynebacterium sp. TaxID=1720 RepID=UPI0025C4A4A4|nr:DUF3592 domain-containing protein [Corynebacterium sp.]
MLTVPSFIRSFRPSRTLVHRRLVQLVLALFLLATAVCGMVVVNAAVNDVKISRDRGVAVADVLSEGATTLVRFRDDTGVYHQPDRGLKYPTGLSRGDRVYVDYQRSDPENVKVQGRAWTLSLIPAVSVWVVATAVTGLLFGAVRLWWRRGKAGEGPSID